MKIISLNTYGGKFFEPLMDFVKANASDTDIFCFQEMLHTSEGSFISNGAVANLFNEFKGVFKNSQAFFAVAQEHFDQTTLVSENVDSGLATFIDQKYKIRNTGEFFICNGPGTFIPNDYGTLPYKIHYTQLIVGRKQVTICNVHGVSEPSNKLDSSERLAQSQKILNFVNEQEGEKIIVGDFNLFPETKSIRMFEDSGYRNLIKDFGVSTTRGSLLKKIHPEYEHSANGWQEFADYTFISRGILPIKFEVPDLPISDHLPMILDFEIKG